MRNPFCYLCRHDRLSVQYISRLRSRYLSLCRGHFALTSESIVLTILIGPLLSLRLAGPSCTWAKNRNINNTYEKRLGTIVPGQDTIPSRFLVWEQKNEGFQLQSSIAFSFNIISFVNITCGTTHSFSILRWTNRSVACSAPSVVHSITLK